MRHESAQSTVLYFLSYLPLNLTNVSLNWFSLTRVHITLLEFYFLCPATVYRVNTKRGYNNGKMYSTYTCMSWSHGNCETFNC